MHSGLKSQNAAESSDNLIIWSLIASVLLLLTGPGVFAGFLLSLLTTTAIFLNPGLRDRISIVFIGLLANTITGSFVVLWVTQI